MTDGSASATLDRLAAEFWEGILARNPLMATQLGDERYADRLPDRGPTGREEEAAAMTDALRRSARLEGAEGLDAESLITYDLLVLVARNRLDLFDAKEYQMAAVDHIFGVQTIPANIAQFQPADTAERLDRLLARLSAYPDLVSQEIANLREGLSEGRMAPVVAVQRTIDQIDRILALPPADSAPATTVRVTDEGARARVVEAVSNHVYPALSALRDFLVTPYAARARESPGLHAVPGGDRAYEIWIRNWTSLDLNVHEIHRFGHDELKAIETEMDAIASRAGHRGRSAYAGHLAADPSNRPSARESLLRLAIAQTEAAARAAPAFFGRVPHTACEVLPVEEYREQDTPGAFYVPPAADGSRPGRYYVNTHNPPEQQLHQLAATTFHEATPGHHFQIGIEMELEHLPPFRRFGSRMAGVAYGEGWGLYSERLADEMDLYRSEAERFGMLEQQAFRAARLVVDSGLHAFGWSREHAITFMVERGARGRSAAEIEVDRYSVWPAQALSYKIGQREIEQARAATARLMGKRFELRRFHDEVLAHGAIPLPTLRERLPGWVASPRVARG